jgi:hypothetical protein
LEAVPTDTSASAATSRMVTRLGSGPLGGKGLLHHFHRPTVGTL